MELAYLLLVSDLLLGLALLGLYRERTKPPRDSADDLAVQQARRSALEAAEEARRAAAELEALCARAERLARGWVEEARRRPGEQAEERLGEVLRSIRRV